MGWREKLRSAVSPAAATARPAVSAPTIWTASTTIAYHVEPCDVVGESHYQGALEQASGGRTEKGAATPRVIAELVREPRNRHDRNAVAVQVGGSTVGYIPRSAAPRWGPIVEHLWETGFLATAYAEITGGWDRGRRDRGSFGLQLWCADPPEVFDPQRHPTLVPQYRVSVTGEQHHQDLLAPLDGLDGLVRLEVATHPRRDSELAVRVRIAGDVIGYLTSKMSGRYGPLIESYEREGRDAFALASARQREKKIEAYVYLPSIHKY